MHRVDPRLAELDFGHWDGLAWDAIGAAAVTAWTDDFARHAPGGGEAVDALLRRCADFLADPALRADTSIVGHAGWISAALWLQASPGALPTAAAWPAAIGYGRRLTLPPTR